MLPWENWLIMGVGVYLLIGYAVHRWVHWMVWKKYAGEWTEENRQDIDSTLSLVSVMVKWPKVVWKPLLGMLFMILAWVVYMILRFVVAIHRRFKRK